MMALLQLAVSLLALTTITDASPQARPFNHALRARQDSGSDPLTVDLGYGVYRGYANASTNINTWRGCVIML
jgi:hypothetical protein